MQQGMSNVFCFRVLDYRLRIQDEGLEGQGLGFHGDLVPA